MESANFPIRYSVLRCGCHSGKLRYDLPALRVGVMGAYDVFWRPAPAEVIHHGKKTRTVLPHREFVFVGVGLHHCISISVDDAGLPLGAYVNINLPPQPTANGWKWEDLELDWKFRVDYRGRWVPLLLDLTEFQDAPLTQEQRRVALTELTVVLRQAAGGVFPFVRGWVPFLDIALPVG